MSSSIQDSGERSRREPLEDAALFYTGIVGHRKQLHPGVHEPLVSQELFDLVQDRLRKNSGRSETLSPRPKRQYLLKGIIRCALLDADVGPDVQERQEVLS